MWTDDRPAPHQRHPAEGADCDGSSGGVKKLVTTYAPDETSHRAAVVLPGGKALLMTVWTDTMHSWDDARIEGVVLATGERKVLDAAVCRRYRRWATCFSRRAGRLLVVPFDADRIEVRGTPKVVIDGVNTDSVWGYAYFAVSPSGSLVYTRGGANTRPSSLFWLDRAGRAELVTDLDQQAYHVRISPAEFGPLRWSNVRGGNEMWTQNIRRAIPTKLVSGDHAGQRVGMTDGSQILVGSSGGAVSTVTACAYNQWMERVGRRHRTSTPVAIQTGGPLAIVAALRGARTRTHVNWSREGRQAGGCPVAASARGPGGLRTARGWPFNRRTARDEVGSDISRRTGALACVDAWRAFSGLVRNGARVVRRDDGERWRRRPTSPPANCRRRARATVQREGVCLDESSYDVSPEGRFSDDRKGALAATKRICRRTRARSSIAVWPAMPRPRRQARCRATNGIPRRPQNECSPGNTSCSIRSVASKVL